MGKGDGKGRWASHRRMYCTVLIITTTINHKVEVDCYRSFGVLSCLDLI